MELTKEELSIIPIGSRSYFRHKDAHRTRIRQQRAERKRELVRLFGGQCSECGYNDSYAALDFDHLDPNTKEFQIGQQISTMRWDRLVREAEKCRLLCANCHRRLTYESDKAT